jgi:hypothetical protein
MTEAQAIMTHKEKVQKLRRLRAELLGASTDLSIEVVDGVETIFARPIPEAEAVPIATLTQHCGWADRNLILGIVSNGRFIVDLFDEACAAYRRVRPAPEPKPTDYTQQCAILCGDRRFQRFLHEQHGLDNYDDKIRVESCVRSMLSIQSRKQLNEDPEAAARWETLRAAYYTWKNRP